MIVPDEPESSASRREPSDPSGRIKIPSGREAEEIVRAISLGEVDAVVVHDQETCVHSLESSDRWSEMNDMLRAIRHGEVDAFVVDEEGEDRVYTWARLEQALHEREQAHRVALEHLQLALSASGAVNWEWELGSEILPSTPGYCEFYGFPSGEPVQFTAWRDRVHPEDIEQLLRRMQTKVHTPGDDEWREEFRIIHPTKGVRWVAGLGRITRDSTGRGVLMRGISFDITERKDTEAELLCRRLELEEQVQQRTRQLTEMHQRLRLADRMAAVGTLAAGLAHDISNVTLPLGMRLNLLLANPSIEPPVKSELAVFTALVDHLRQMSRNLSLFARDPEHEGSEGRTELLQWSEQVKRFMEASVSGDARRSERWIQVMWDVPADLPAVAVSPHRLTQAVLNLVHNARDAISEARSNEAPGTPRQGTIKVQALSTDDRAAIALTVSDDGIGMDEQTKRRCIEPFYTTKNRPQSAGAAGSGMGLATAYAIVLRVGGQMLIESELGKGTTIRLLLPIATPNLATTGVREGTHLASGVSGQQSGVRTA